VEIQPHAKKTMHYILNTQTLFKPKMMMCFNHMPIKSIHANCFLQLIWCTVISNILKTCT